MTPTTIPTTLPSDSAVHPWRAALVQAIGRDAQPPEKFSHQPRLYRLTRQIGEALAYDDDVVFAAAWVHDLGVFTGHRPEDAKELKCWNSTAYTLGAAPAYLRRAGFPEDKLSAVIECIRTHEAHEDPQSVEATILRDADILEQLGAVGVMRTACKIGRDTRFATFADAVATLSRALQDLPEQLRLPSSQAIGVSRVSALRSFLGSLEEESSGHL